MIYAYYELADDRTTDGGLIDLSECPTVLSSISINEKNGNKYIFMDDMSWEDQVQFTREWNKASEKEISYPTQVEGFFTLYSNDILLDDDDDDI